MRASDFAGLVPECCSEVLGAMYFVTVLGWTALEKMPEALPGGDAVVAFGLQFAGDISGRFGVCLGQLTARSLAANFLGVDEPEISSREVAEVVGELANMLCGSAMSRVEGERKLILSHPEAVPLPADIEDIHIVQFDTDSGAITAWLVLEGNS
jgi:CheY-specific phosphatase CheX